MLHLATPLELLAWLGSHMVLRHGARLVRPLLVSVSVAMSVKLLL